MKKIRISRSRFQSILADGKPFLRRVGKEMGVFCASIREAEYIQAAIMAAAVRYRDERKRK